MLSKKILAILLSGCLIVSCSKNVPHTSSRDTINIGLNDDVSTFDPTITQDVSSARVLNDLFEGLVTENQKNQPIPGLAKSWDILNNNKTYVFHLRDNLKFSDGSPITADDVVFTWRRLVDPKTGSTFSFLANNIVNAKEIIAGKKPITSLGIRAIDKQNIQFNLVRPDPTFLAICTEINVAVISQANVIKYGSSWTEPKNIVTSGAYKLTSRINKGDIILSKNVNYYDASNVAIDKVKFTSFSDLNSEFNMYKTGEIDITSDVPHDQYNTIKKDFPTELHTVSAEAMYYYRFNLKDPLIANNVKLRQALSMVIDRDVLVNKIVAQGETPSYTIPSYTVENGKYRNTDVYWASWPMSKKITEARKLYNASGYDQNTPLTLELLYSSNDINKKIALTIGYMWTKTLGVNVKYTNAELKTFLSDIYSGKFEVASERWYADYNSVNNYIDLYECDNPENKIRFCNSKFDTLLEQAANSFDKPTTRDDLARSSRSDNIKQAIKIIEDSYAMIPLFQGTYSKLVSLKVQGYDIDNNHLDHVQTKWLYLK